MISTSEGKAVAIDASEVIFADIANFAVGLVKKRPGEASVVMGSGVLASLEGRKGILTCAHVADLYDGATEIGLTRFTTGNPQRRTLPMGPEPTIIVRSEAEYSENTLDLAFTPLLLSVVGSLEAQHTFLNLEINRGKIEAGEPQDTKHVDVMLGLVDEFSGEPFIEGGEIVAPMRGVFHTGHAVSKANGLIVFDAMEYNLKELPEKFGGMSGAGVWRVHFAEEGGEVRIVNRSLRGVATYQIDERHIACQGWERIDQGLIPEILKGLGITPSNGPA